MLPLNFIPLLVSLTLGLALVPQDAGKPAAPRKRTGEAHASLLASMQGAWRLKMLESPGLSRRPRQEVAYCLIAENFLSLELHLGWLDPNGVKVENRDFQSGTHRVDFDSQDRMVTSTLIGANFSMEGRLVFEQPGRLRTYQVTVVGPAMIWKREDGARFEFELISEGKVRRDAPARATGEGQTPEGTGDKKASGDDVPPK